MVVPRLLLYADLERLLRAARASWSDIAGLLGVLRRERVPLVLCSNQTRAQLEALRQQFDLRAPFISENGGAVFVPAGCLPAAVAGARRRRAYELVEFGRPYAQVVAALESAAARVGVDVIGFDSMSVEQVALDCDVPIPEARLARLREYEEVFHVVSWTPGARDRLARELERSQLWCRYDGRFDRVSGAVDAGEAVDALSAIYRRAFGFVLTVGIGSDMNDVAMLRRVDIAIAAPDDSGAAARSLLREVPTAIVPPHAGPAGWLSAVDHVLRRVLDGAQRVCVM